MTGTPTLSQTFDTNEFIAPDICTVVDASVRAAESEIFARGCNAEEIDETTKTAGDIALEDIAIPPAPDIVAPAQTVLEGIAVEIPPVKRINSGIRKVGRDTFIFNEEFWSLFKRVAAIAIIAAVILLLLYYLFYQ